MPRPGEMSKAPVFRSFVPGVSWLAISSEVCSQPHEKIRQKRCFWDMGKKTQKTRPEFFPLVRKSLQILGGLPKRRGKKGPSFTLASRASGVFWTRPQDLKYSWPYCSPARRRFSLEREPALPRILITTRCTTLMPMPKGRPILSLPSPLARSWRIRASIAGLTGR
jgi:hypothetical protein